MWYSLEQRDSFANCHPWAYRVRVVGAVIGNVGFLVAVVVFDYALITGIVSGFTPTRWILMGVSPLVPALGWILIAWSSRMVRQRSFRRDPETGRYVWKGKPTAPPLDRP